MDGWEVGTLESRQGLTEKKVIYTADWVIISYLPPFASKSNCLEAEMDMKWKDACRCSSDRKVFLRGEMLYGVHSYWWLCISCSVNLPLVVSSVSWETSIRNAILISYLLYRSMYAETHLDLKLKKSLIENTPTATGCRCLQQSTHLGHGRRNLWRVLRKWFAAFVQVRQMHPSMFSVKKLVLGANEIPCWTKKFVWLGIDLMFSSNTNWVNIWKSTEHLKSHIFIMQIDSWEMMPIRLPPVSRWCEKKCYFLQDRKGEVFS